MKQRTMTIDLRDYPGLRSLAKTHGESIDNVVRVALDQAQCIPTERFARELGHLKEADRLEERHA